MNHIDLVTLIIIALSFIVMLWLIKKYFQHNSDQILKNNYFANAINNIIAGESTITESNKDLRNKAFDGINENPNPLNTNPATLKELDQRAENNDNYYDLAHESIAHQPQNTAKKIN